MDLNNQLVEKFSQEMVDELGGEYMFMGFTEDELIFMDGICKTLAELSEITGSEPSMELHGLMARIDEAVMEFYENEEDKEEEE